MLKKISLGILLGTTTFMAFSIPSAGAQSGLYEQRTIYKKALQDLNAGRSTAFQNARRDLASYALFPYLDYHALRRRLSSARKFGSSI